MGSGKTGLVGTIGLTLLNPDGTVHTVRTTAGIYEIGGGCYGKNTTFPDDWKGSLKWDTGGGNPVYAVEDYVEGLIDEVEEGIIDIKGTGFVKDSHSLTNVEGYYAAQLGNLEDEALGRWVVDHVANTLTLYRQAGTVLKVFDLVSTAGTVPNYVERIPQ